MDESSGEASLKKPWVAKWMNRYFPASALAALSCASVPISIFALWKYLCNSSASRCVPGSEDIRPPRLRESMALEGESIGRDGESIGREGESNGREAESIGRDGESIGRWPGRSSRSPNRLLD